MADTIDLTPLLLEIRETNRLTQSLRDLAIKDDTPAERVKDQLPEILAERRFIDEQIDNADTIAASTEKSLEPLNEIVTGLADRNQDINDFVLENAEALRDFVDIQMDTLDEIKKQTAILNMNALGIEKVFQSIDNQTKKMEELDKAVIGEMKTQAEQIEKASPVPITKKEDEAKKVKPKPATGKEEEEQKDDRTFLQKTVGFITSPIKSLKNTFDSFSKSFTIGNATLVTVLTLLVTGLIAFFPKFSNFVGALASIIGNLVTGDFEAAGQIAADNIGGIIILGLLMFRKRVMKLFMARVMPVIAASYVGLTIKTFLSTFAAVGRGLLALNPAARLAQALLAIIVVFGKSIVDGFRKGGFKGMISAIITQIFSMIGAVFKLIGKGLSFLFGGTTAPDDVEPRQMGGAVAGGSPYLVGEQGAELFVPGSAGSIVPGLGGGNVVINNNQVNQSASTSNHQHTNTSIVDSQQEITGL